MENVDHKVEANKLTLSKWGETSFSIKTKHPDHKHNIYPIVPSKTFDKSSIRYIQTGEIDPITIAAHYELDRHIHWNRQTIVYHIPDRYSMMYYGFYPVSKYIESCDLPEIRVSGMLENNPMVMDSGLPLIDVHYHPERDDLEKLDSSMKQAVIEIVGKYVEVSGKGHKLYFKDGDKQVKFFSTAFVEGHYYFYINLDTDYNKAYDYYKPDVKKNIKDEYAYGLKSVADIPDDLVDQIIRRYSELYGVPLEDSKYTDEELSIIDSLKPVMESQDWIQNAERDDVWTYSAIEPEIEGHEYEVILDKKPETNIIPLEVETNDLVFYYQPKETRENHYRPPHIEGSFAVYHADETKHHVSERYKAGKAFHIHRPWVVDSTGKKVWCSFDPNWNGTTDLEITIPQDFLDTAVYPITIDPTFGYTTAGGSSVANTATTYLNLLSQTGFAGTAKDFVWYGTVGSSSANPVNIASALYNHGTGALVEYSGQYNYGVNISNTWFTYAATQGATLSAISYDIGLIIGIPSPAGYIAGYVNYDTSTSAGGLTTTVTYSSPPPSTQPTVTGNNDKFSIFVSSVVYAGVFAEAWGGGAGGSSDNFTTTPSSGGGGGAFSLGGVAVATGTGYTVTVGAAGTGETSSAAATAGGDSWFGSTTTVLAKGGSAATGTSAGGVGGATASGFPIAGGTLSAGGNGGLGVSAGSGAGGGGAGGLAGAGGNGTNAITGTGNGGAGGAGDNGSGGAGGATATSGSNAGTANALGGGGGSGAKGTATAVTGGAGGAPGGAGGGGSTDGSASSGGAGAKGQVIVYAPLGIIASATGGTHTTDSVNDYWTFTSTGTWTPTVNIPQTGLIRMINQAVKRANYY